MQWVQRIWTCSLCPNFALHQVCGAYPDTFVHPFIQPRSLNSARRPILDIYCDACGEAPKGFVYESLRPNSLRPLRLHPLCVALPTTLNYDGHLDHPVQLIREMGNIRLQ
ncbi:hypothetical protein SUGI_0966100 [Cryptomeria japonica]|nr:hypothetical protein SUGI_0966100 [Cryptomeria japonica]